jgi:hypothetical protein
MPITSRGFIRRRRGGFFCGRSGCAWRQCAEHFWLGRRLAADERKAAMQNLQPIRKPYMRPQLRTHGSVEQLTQQTDPGTLSNPIVFSAKHKK